MKKRIVYISEKTIPLEENYFRQCHFCNKLFVAKEEFRFFSKDNYCNFCLRHNHQEKESSNILILSFKFVLTYIYERKIFWKSQIEDLIQIHKQIGLKNPVFNYDEDNLFWYINFNHVGQYKVPLSCVKQTIKEIILSFNLEKYNVEVDVFEKKYMDAIDLFYKKRYRPKNKKILIPTFKGCIEEKIDNCDVSDDFLTKSVDK